jgi:hypothetical protein
MKSAVNWRKSGSQAAIQPPGIRAFARTHSHYPELEQLIDRRLKTSGRMRSEDQRRYGIPTLLLITP